MFSSIEKGLSEGRKWSFTVYGATGSSTFICSFFVLFVFFISFQNYNCKNTKIIKRKIIFFEFFLINNYLTP